MNKSSLITLWMLSLFSATAQVPTNGRIGSYPFCGNSNDISGNMNHGSNHFVAPGTDRFGRPGNAYTFNGYSSYIELPTSAFVGRDVYSYSIWFKAATSA